VQEDVVLAAEQELVPVGHDELNVEGIELNPTLARLPVQLDVKVPVRNFRVHNLLSLEPGTVVETEWGHGEDTPLISGKVQLAWCEFEVVDTQLAVRITRLA
jgi:flagellar motor switch protein FliM